MILEKIEEETIERRRYERLQKRVALRFGLFVDLSTVTIDREGTLLDISGGGLRLMADEAFDVATQLMIVLEFPGWKPGKEEWALSENVGDIGVLKVVGIVVRCMPSSLDPGKFEIAVCFCGHVKK